MPVNIVGSGVMVGQTIGARDSLWSDHTTRLEHKPYTLTHDATESREWLVSGDNTALYICMQYDCLNLVNQKGRKLVVFGRKLEGSHSPF